MRNLKFKIWDKADQEWTSYAPVFSSAHGKIFEFFLSQYQVENLVIQQSTGLKDKNNKEIYEGDIVKGFFFDTDYMCNEVLICPVQWSNRTASFNIGHRYWDSKSMEVVGNIFENSELLKQ